MAKKNKRASERSNLIDSAKNAINRVADDKSVDIESSISDLEELAFVVDACIDGLRDDLKNEE